MKGRLLPVALLALGEAPLLEKPEKKSPREWILERTGEDIAFCPNGRKGMLPKVQPLPPLDLQPLWWLNLWFYHDLLPSARAS
ncbi:MAG: hypothetical protein O3B01_23050 [Planctomycetota bacterium]|nr:hypothetical protein [Planctomycetota bacterium]MDA1141450.1 hypothetical protein [Planctomycetota bacterium]